MLVKPTQAWGRTIASYDGFVWVTPEYNHGVPAAMKNALDVLWSEWNNKTVGFVAYGFDGGTRAVEQWRMIVAAAFMIAVRPQVALQNFADFDMRDYGAELIGQRRVSMARLDDAVRRILRVKFRAGLFDHPYVDPAKADAAQLQPDAVKAAREAAGRSMVLLKNADDLLPLDPTKKTAVIGPLADNQHDMLGPWWGKGVDTDAVSVLDGIAAQSPGATYAQGCKLENLEPPNNTPEIGRAHV